MSKQRSAGRRRDGWRALLRTLGRLRLPWGWIAVALALNLGFNTLILYLPDTTAALMSGQLTGGALTKAIMHFVSLALLSFVLVAGQAQARACGARCARQRIWRRMLHMHMPFFDRNDPSDLMSAITTDARSAVEGLVNCIIYLIPDLYYIVMALRRINQYHWILAVSCFALLPIKYLYALLMGKQMQKHTARLYDRIGRLTGFLADRIHHLPLIKVCANEQAEGEAGEAASEELLRANMKLVQLDNLSVGATAVIDLLQKFIVIVVAVLLLQQRRIDLAMWLAFFLFSQNLFPTMDEVFDLWIRIKGMHGSFRRIVEVMEGEVEDTQGLSSFPQRGDLRFEHVSFAYPGTDEPALRDVSFTVPRGTSVAIVGLCGSGKTTALSLLERFYEPTEGRILLGETPLCDIPLHELRRRIAYVQQGAGVFGGTLRQALTYGIDRPLSDEELLAAAEKTGFSDYLVQCPQGLDTPVAPGGGSMSGGQSQRLVLTRELLRGGELILMDEPTSALDVRISARLRQVTDELFADKTRLLITHDLSLARCYARILVLENGRLIGDGSHETLLKTCAAYRELNENAGEEVPA